MVLINCPECQKQISEQANICPNCGYVLAKSNKLHIAAIILFILSAIALSVTIIQLWWGTWTTFAIYLGIALLLAAIGVFIQIYPTLREKRKIKTALKNKTETPINKTGDMSSKTKEEMLLIKNLDIEAKTSTLKWHKFVYCIFLPISIVVNLINIFLIIRSLTKSTYLMDVLPISIFIIALMVLQTIFNSLLIFELKNFTKRAYTILFAVFVMTIIFNLVPAIVANFSFWSIIIYLIFWIPTIVYYYKRKSLFVN